MVEAKTRTYTEFKRVKHNRNLTEPGFSATSGVIVKDADANSESESVERCLTSDFQQALHRLSTSRF